MENRKRDIRIATNTYNEYQETLKMLHEHNPSKPLCEILDSNYGFITDCVIYRLMDLLSLKDIDINFQKILSVIQNLDSEFDDLLKI